MKKKLILFNTLLVILALLLMFGLGILVTRNEHYVQAEEKIREIEDKIFVIIYEDNSITIGDNNKMKNTSIG